MEMTKFQELVLRALAGIIWMHWGRYTMAHDVAKEIELLLIDELVKEGAQDGNSVC